MQPGSAAVSDADRWRILVVLLGVIVINVALRA